MNFSGIDPKQNQEYVNMIEKFSELRNTELKQLYLKSLNQENILALREFIIFKVIQSLECNKCKKKIKDIQIIMEEIYNKVHEEEESEEENEEENEEQ